MALTPFLMYLIFESAAGSLREIRLTACLFNLAFYYMFYLVLTVVLNSTRAACIFLNTILTALALGEYYVVSFRYRPIMVWDVLSMRTAVSVSANYQYEITPRVALTVILSLALSFLAFRFPLRFQTGKTRLRTGAAVLLLSAQFLGYFYSGAIDRYDLNIRMWDPAVSYREDGYILSTMVGLSYLKPQAPDGYSPERAAEIADAAPARAGQAEEIAADQLEQAEGAAAAQADKAAGTASAQTEQAAGTASAQADQAKGAGRRWATDTDVTPTHIICIMNESFSDLGEIREFPTNLPYLEFYKSLDKNCIKGNLYVPVFGAMTCNTEFEFLTGSSLAFAPEGSVPFQRYMKDPSYSLASVLKDQGYETIAMHPYPADNWNREKAYVAMGFDTFLAEEFYEGSEHIRGYVSDRADYEKITEVTKSRQGEPTFIFNVTMQNHGGYGDADYEAEVYPLEYEDAPLAKQYLSLMRESDQALQYLIEYYEKAEDPTMIVLFGDHRPGLETGFYEYLFGKPMEELTVEDYADLYTTPFLVWTNYETPYEESEGMSAQYLSTCVLERGNLELSGWHELLDSMSRQAPAVHFLGYKDRDGQWNPWDGWEKRPEAGILRDVMVMQYNNMFDREHRCDAFFRASSMKGR